MTIQPVIAITLYRRERYTRILFDTLDKCYGMGEFPVTISVDISEQFRDDSMQVLALAEAWAAKWNAITPDLIRIYTNEPRLGIDLNKLFVAEKAFERGDYMILIEDDIGLAPDALRYFCAMGERYLRDKSVFSVSGYNRVDAEKWIYAQQLPYAVELSRGYCPWGTGIFKDRWNEIFGDGGERYKKETGKQANGLHDHFLNELHRRVVVPVVGRTNHLGWENSEHTPSHAFLMANEYCRYWAVQLDLPDAGTAPW